MTVWAINFSKVLCVLHPRWFICETWWNTGMGLIEQWFFLLPQVVWAVGIILRTCPNMWIVIYYNKPIEKPYKPASVNKILFHCSICDTPKHWRIAREGNIFQQIIDDVFFCIPLRNHSFLSKSCGNLVVFANPKDSSDTVSDITFNRTNILTSNPAGMCSLTWGWASCAISWEVP